MNARGFLVCAVAIAAACAPATDATRPDASALPATLAARIDPVIEAVWDDFDADAAVADVAFASERWRLAGNSGFDAVIDRARTRLEETGFQGSVRVESYPIDTPAWEYSVGTLALVRDGRDEQLVLSREQDRLALCINSFSTPPGGVVARLVDVGAASQPDDFAGFDMAGAVVLGDASAGVLWRRAVVAGHALGVISTSLGSYVNPDPPGTASTPRDEWDILQWGSVPYDAAVRGFGFKASPRAAATLRRAVTEGGPDAARVRVTIASTFTEAPARTLVAEIPGRDAPDERVVIAAHVQEPGANDNASGVATLTELARTISDGIRSGRIPPPARTLTFLWIDEIAGSRHWLADHPTEASGARYMFSMDMTGEDVSKTGGSFLIERWPDPGAVWDRPWDPHSEWGSGDVSADSLKGDLINDLHLAVCRRVASRTGWIVNTNPYEGGSDHTVFGRAGVPAVLDWHFTDRYYHTNLDTADKTSGDEMKNVATAVAASAWLMASADEAVARDVARLVSDAGHTRLAVEIERGQALVATEADPSAAQAREDTIVAAWRRWYAEAVQSVSRLVVGGPSDALRAELDTLSAVFTR